MSTTSTPRGNWPSPPPMAPSADFGHRAHTVQFYGKDSFLLDELCRFVGTALGAGNAAVVIASRQRREALVQGLKAKGLDAEVAARQGRYIAIDAAETLEKFMRDGSPVPALFAEVLGGVMDRAAAAAGGSDAPISAFGEMVALLWAQGNAEAAIQVEQLWNELAQNYSLSLRCAYPMDGFDREYHSDAFLKICTQHSHVVPVESYTALINDQERARTITHLQQRAQALEAEMEVRKQIEETLRRTKADLESQVERRTAALRQLSSRLLSLQDSERRRIARELHDSLGQYLVGLKLNVDMLRRAPEREELWCEAEGLMQQCISEVRTLSYLLHPPTMDAAGFASAARWYIEGFGHRSGVQVTLNAPDDLGRLPDAVELALFRVLQETLTNVHRHSGAAAAEIMIRKDGDCVVLEVKDNGQGIDPELLNRFLATGEGMGVGLAGIGERMREFGGELRLESHSSGTLLRVTIPVPARSET
jgi:signal transduction histidine kinase